AADRAQLLRAHPDQVLALPERFAARDRGLAIVQAHDRQAGDSLPAARLADDAERLALLDREADPVDGLDDPVVRPEVRLQFLDVEKGHAIRVRMTPGWRMTPRLRMTPDRGCWGAGPELCQPDPGVDHCVEQVDD